MSAETEISELELSALVSSKICHDIISPVGAIANGLEVLDEEIDQDMRDHAMNLIRRSATQASAKLQFARLAFGAAGSAGAEIDLTEAEKVTRGVAESDKHTVEWTGPAATIAKDKAKLLLNLVTLALAALPRGGALKISITGDVGAPSFEVNCQGEAARIPDDFGKMLSGTDAPAVDAQTIQPYYTLRIAKSAGMSLTARANDGGIVLSAAPVA